MDAAWASAESHVPIVDNRSALDDRPVDIDAIAAPTAANTYVHDRTVIRERSAAPQPPAKPTPM